MEGGRKKRCGGEVRKDKEFCRVDTKTCKEKPYRKVLSPSPSSLGVLLFRSQEFVQVNALVCQQNI